MKNKKTIVVENEANHTIFSLFFRSCLAPVLEYFVSNDYLLVQGKKKCIKKLFSRHLKTTRLRK